MRTEERKQFLMDLLTCGVEGGIGYWARIYDSERTPELDWVSITLVDHEDASQALELEPFTGYGELDDAVLKNDPRIEKFKFTVTLDDIEKALEKLIASPAEVKIHPSNIGQLIVANATNGEDGDFDADSGDWLVQIACFGEVVYG